MNEENGCRFDWHELTGSLEQIITSSPLKQNPCYKVTLPKILKVLYAVHCAFGRVLLKHYDLQILYQSPVKFSGLGPEVYVKLSLCGVF